jgi:hypothetical protein
MTQPIKSILTNIIPKEHQWKLALMQAWDSILGTMASKATIERIDQTTIHIAVSHPAWAHELHMLTPILLEKINAHLPEHPILHLRFKYKKPEAPKTLAWRLYQKATPLALPALTPEETNLLASVTNKELQSYIATYFKRCKALKGRKKG